MILDSGASINTINDIRFLTNIKKCKSKILLADGNEVLSEFCGDFVGIVNNNKFILKDVYYSRYIKRNLISINQLISQNYKVFNNHDNSLQALIYHNKENRIYKCLSNDKNTYQIFTSKHQIILNSTKSNEINYTHSNNQQVIDLWHRRLGHYDISKIKNKLSNINLKLKCPVCINFKLKNKSFKSSINKTKQILELIHLDFVGPVTPSINNNKYFLIILDDYSRYGWVIFTENKNDVFNKFIIWYNKIYNSLNINIKAIRSDNGKEFQNSKFQLFCEENGINHQFLVPYNPSQNGRSEGFNGILIAFSKSLLNDAKLNHNFWEFAVDTANYIHNRLPHQSIQNKIHLKYFIISL